MSPGLTMRVPVEDEDGGLLGWVVWDEVGEFAELGDYVVPATFYLRLPSSPTEPALQLTFAMRDGSPVCIAANVEAKAQGQVLPKDFDVIRRELNNWSEFAFSYVMRATQEHAPGFVDDRTAHRAYRVGRNRTRRKVTDELLQEVAALYRDTVDSGPWRAIAERFSVSETTAGRYVGLARKAGYLPATRPGKKKV
jgi:hypothetical protein